jgi:Cdc6-like AAA superfamily ATPase
MPHVHCIYICNDEDAFFGRLDERVASRIRAGEAITLDRYSRDSLVDILEARAEAGLEPRVAPEPRLRDIADRVAGDARTGVEMLHQAARRARAKGHEFIREQDIADAEPVARAELRQKTLSQLTRHQRVVYEVLTDDGGALPIGEIETRYRERVSDPRSTKTLRRYLRKLAEYNLVDADGETSDRTYQTRC